MWDITPHALLLHPGSAHLHSGSCRGDQGEIKIINNNNHLLGPLQNRIAMATACWQRCCLADGKRLPGTDANSSNATPVQRVAVQGQAR